VQGVEQKNAVTCPRCKEKMHRVYFGDEVVRWRCLGCDVVFSSLEWVIGKGELVRKWREKRGGE